ncbi:MAG: hypothetical protein ABI600_11110 [Luteolibacter sp.]
MEPAHPEALVPDSQWEPWMLPAAVALLLVITLWIILWKRKKPASDPLAIRNAAYQEAADALDKITAAQGRDAAVLASLILRKYLSTAADDPALFETHEEFISRHDGLKALTMDARQAAEAGFTRLASLKYAAEVPDAVPLEVVGECRLLLETLHHGFAA